MEDKWQQVSKKVTTNSIELPLELGWVMKSLARLFNVVTLILVLWVIGEVISAIDSILRPA